VGRCYHFETMDSLPRFGSIAMGGAIALVAYSALSCSAETDGGGGDGGSSSSSGIGGVGAHITGGARPADGVIISSVEVYQGVRRPLMENGVPIDSAVPVVLGRDALFRIFYHTDPGSFNGQPVAARLSLGENEPIVVQAALSGTSDPANLNSTVNLFVPGTAMTAYTYRVELLHPATESSGQSVSSVYPLEGQQALPTFDAGPQVKLVLIPVAYAADGSNRLPDTSAAQLQLYTDYFKKIYPTPNMQIMVAGATNWSQTVSPNGQGWGELLDAIRGLRQQSGAAPDEYYYGVFNPAASFAQFCGGGCVAGLSNLAGPTDAAFRAGIGLGFTGPGSAETAVHEVGHEHGLGHAPCGTNNGLDFNFPYPDGSLGTWGYDLITGALVGPEVKDMMSYCDPIWISDYHFIRLFDRIRMVNAAAGADVKVPAALLDRTYEQVRVEMDGTASWQDPITLHMPPQGEPQTLTANTAAGMVELTGHFYPYSHIPGGVLVFPQTTPEAHQIAFEIATVEHLVSR
jgi:hypothetical protein